MTTCRARWARSSPRAKGIKTAYVLHDKTAYGQGIAEYFKKEGETQGIKVVGFAGTEEKANFDAILSPILASKPECIYFGGMFDQAAVLFKQARQKGFKGMCLSDDGFDSADAAKIGGDALLEGAGTYFSTVSGPANVYPDTAKFVADFKAKFGNNPQPFAAQSFDCAAILLKAIENAAKAAGGKMPTREAVVQGRARPQGLPRHHRHHHLQWQGRPGQGQVLHHPGHLRRSRQVGLEPDRHDPGYRSSAVGHRHDGMKSRNEVVSQYLKFRSDSQFDES